MERPTPAGCKRSRRVSAALLALCVAGCATAPPYVGQGPHPQMTRGAAIPPLDFLGNVLALPGKLILWNWNFDNHAISTETEAGLQRYLDAKTSPSFEDTRYRLNEYSPLRDLGGLIHNHHVGWPYRLLLGVPITVIYDVLLPGRLFPWGDYYNPYTNVAHLYSDDLTVALHEAGHAYDFSTFPYRGTYATLRLLPFLDLYQEWMASEQAITYLEEVGDRQTEYHAYRTLWPAYGTYAGGYLPIPFGSAAGALFGHIAGRLKARTQRRYYEQMDLILTAPERSLHGELPAPTPQKHVQSVPGL